MTAYVVFLAHQEPKETFKDGDVQRFQFQAFLAFNAASLKSLTQIIPARDAHPTQEQ
jgi:hypothetical protein